jgi:hypothetical protein
MEIVEETKSRRTHEKDEKIQSNKALSPPPTGKRSQKSKAT